jgi:hypothetical protein
MFQHTVELCKWLPPPLFFSGSSDRSTPATLAFYILGRATHTSKMPGVYLVWWVKIQHKVYTLI